MFTRTLSQHQVSAAVSFPGLGVSHVDLLRSRTAWRAAAPRHLNSCFKKRGNVTTKAVFSGITKFEKDQRLVFDITVREGRDVAVNLAIA